jgi:hypothetical protein
MGTHVQEHQLSGEVSCSGRITIGMVVLIFLLVAAVYFAIHLVPPYIENYKFQSALEVVARHGRVEKNDLALMATIQQEAKTLGIFVAANNILIRRDANDHWLEIQTKYAREVSLNPLGFTLSLDFQNNVQEKR